MMIEILTLLAMSAGRMLIAYMICLVIAYILGYYMAREPIIEKTVMPILDVLQSIPILVFFPPVIYIFINTLPGGYGIELAEIFLIITSMVWNMIFSVYESFMSLKQNLRDVSKLFKFNELDKFFKIYLPYISLGLIPNSLASWANGWFFLIATEIISVGNQTYTIQGIGSYIMSSAINGDMFGVLLGLISVSVLIILMDIFIWRPLMNISAKYLKGKKEDMIYDRIWDFRPDAGIKINRVVGTIASFLDEQIIDPLSKIIDKPMVEKSFAVVRESIKYLILLSVVILLLELGYVIYKMVPLITIDDLLGVGTAFMYSFARILIAYVLCMIWIIPAIYFIQKNKKYEENIIRWTEIIGSIPVSAIFPAVIIILTSIFGNFEIVAIIFLMTGMQWYLFFNIYGAIKSIPEYVFDLKTIYVIDNQTFAKKIIMPFMMPFLIIGSIAAIGGGWNAAIVAEFVSFGSSTFEVYGIGSLIHHALVDGDIKLMFLCAMSVAIAIPALNIFFWRPIMKKASNIRSSSL